MGELDEAWGRGVALISPSPPPREERAGVGTIVSGSNPLPMNRSATVLKASRSTCQTAAADLRHSRAPVLGFKARIEIGGIFTPTLSVKDWEHPTSILERPTPND